MMMLTFRGQEVTPGRLDPSQVRIEDIAHALSLLCRFGGHTDVHYSVAQHSLLVVRILERIGAPAGAQLAGLLHDAHEAYIGDVPTPLKTMLGPAWRDLEASASAAVLQALGVADLMQEWGGLVKHADLMALATERRDLIRFDPDLHAPWTILDGIPEFDAPATEGGWSPLWWEEAFLDRFASLTGRYRGRAQATEFAAVHI